MKFKIYAGLGGGFGGAHCIENDEFTNEVEAESYAYDEACNIFERYSCHFEDNLNEIEQVADGDNELYDELYSELRESWLEYYVEQVNDENEEENE